MCFYNWNNLLGLGKYGFGFMLGNFIVRILVLIGLGIFIYFIIRKITQNKSTQKTTLEILNERYAKGEISEEEYDRIRNKLL